MQHVATDVILASEPPDSLFIPDMAVLQKSSLNSKTKSVYVQTDYRDADVQTDPYTPEYVVHPGSQPEILTLATLSWGRGLPAGVAEVEMIERARAKREWEKTLPPLNDLNQLEKRRQMLEAMELKEWALREQMIEKLQLEQLELLKKLLSDREEKQASITNKRLDKIWTLKQKEKEKRFQKIRLDHIRALRKLHLSKKNVERKFERRDIVKDYINDGSTVFAPLTRNGVFPDSKQNQYVVQSSFLSTYDGLLDLEQTLPDFVTNPRIKVPVTPVKKIGSYIKRKYKQEFELKDIHEKILAGKIPKKVDIKPLRYLVKIEKPKPRPPTPSVEGPSPEMEEKELAVIYLQQLLRGKAIHNMGKQKRQVTLALQRQRQTYEHKENIVHEALSRIEGTTIGNMFDFLSKELIRLQEERRIHAFAMLAERQRRIREAEESGLRQEEERRRREDDEIFKQVVKVHQNTVDTYLEDIILQSVEYTAEKEARTYIQQLANKINDITYEMESKRTQLETEEIVGDLIHNFLLPDVEKDIMREKGYSGTYGQ
ncbi:Cilia- and flagella-associated protein 91 [Acanthosepion pharaonis]|uniref:Cilia- and flagella-associated protein 91 n=1 Tax=Acanthosepion pharaonis TaxID=158019 RepID=A0A812BH55_ACAPH|nr:Cilia- and flagella-associated protein 91 [Sepia pharaonis]